jgi:hypothetical protein
MARAADIRISCGFFSHPKTIKLRRRCGDAGVVSLLKLWTFAGQYRTTGSLAGMDAEEIAIAAGWAGDPKEFESTLIDIRFADGATGALRLHDWAEHQPYAAGFEERSKRGQQAARSRWDTASDAGSMQRASERHCEADCSGESDAQADSNASGNADFQNSIATSNAPSPLPVPSPVPFLSAADSNPSKNNNNGAATPSPEEEFKDSPWLGAFLKGQETFNGNLLPKLIHHDFWAEVSDTCNGIDADFLQVEFARMAIWLRENPTRVPTPYGRKGVSKGIRQFVADWLRNARSGKDRRK